MELIDGLESQNGMVFGPTVTVAPHRLNPFPYSTYFIDSAIGPTGSYYNDPTLDAVKLKATYGGDSAAWSDPGTFFNLGLLTPAEAIDNTISYYASGGYYDVGTEILDTWHAQNYYTVNNPIQKIRYSIAGQNDPSPGPQVISLPGVSSLIGYSGTYNAVICQGNPIWFELEFEQNQFKSNPNLYYSGYTSFGDFNQVEFGELYEYPLPLGYTRRYVAGIFKKGADLATCGVEDIILGGIWNATDLGGGTYSGTGHVVLNGVIRASCSTSARPSRVSFYTDPITQNYIADLGNNPQYWQFIELDINDASFSTITYAYAEPFYSPALASDAIDVYDVKYGWYMDYVPDAGAGTFVGEVGFQMPMMYTHPGWLED